jgi:DNA-binding response OmpR family regulator
MAGEHILVIDDSATLLRIVARTLSRAGYKVRTAEGGAKGVTLAKAERPDLILLDYLMPGLNGLQVCRLLGEDARLRDVPVIVMSARGDKVGPRLVEEAGAVDYISKPFSPEALVAVTSHVIDKYVREGTPPPRLSHTPAPGPSPATAAEPAEHARKVAEVRADLVQRLAASLEEALARVPADVSSRGRIALEHAVGAALGDGALSEIAGKLAAAFPEQGLAADVALHGDLARIAVADVLTLLQVQKQTGILTLLRGEARVEVYFHQGRVDWVGGRNLREEFLLGRFIVETGAISRQDLDLFLQSRTGTRKLLGAQLVRLGYITQEDLNAALGRQSSEILYEVMRWGGGRFFFRQTEERPAHVAEAKLNLAVEQLLMEGFRRVDEWSLIEQVIHSFDIVFQRGEDAIRDFGVERLQPEELLVLDLVDGQNCVRDIVEKSRMGSFDTCKLLYRLLSTRLIRKRVEPAPPQVQKPLAG